MKPIVITGTGLAGYSQARVFRRLDAVTPLLMITADEDSFYAKPMLSNALAKGKTAEILATASAEQMAAELGLAVQAWFSDLSGTLGGFALTGAATANERALTKELPAVLP